MAAITVSELPTAEEDPEAWNVIWIAGLPCPGTCLPIEADRFRDVDQNKAKGGPRDILIDQGLSITEASFRIRTTNGDVFRELYDFYLKYMDPDRAPTRLKIIPISHPQLYARGIKLAYFYKAPIPKPTQEAGVRPYIHEFTFKVVSPKTKLSSSTGSSKPKQGGAVGGPTDPNFRSQAGVQGAVGIIGDRLKLLPGVNLFTGSPSAAPTPPPAQPAEMLTPQQVKQVRDAGDQTSRFVAGLFDGAAP